MFFYAKEDTLNISCWYNNWKCVKKGGSRRGVLGGHWGFLTGDMEDMFILDVIYDVFYPKEDTLKVSSWYLYGKYVRKGVSRRGVLGGHWVFLIGHMEDGVILDIMDDVFFTLVKIRWKFRADIFMGGVSERRGQEAGYLEDVGRSWQEILRTGSSLMSWMMFFYHKEDTLEVSCWFLNGKCIKKGCGGKKECTCITLRVTDQRHGGQGHPWHYGCTL